MQAKGVPWFMRLTLVNNQTRHVAFAIYPCDKYEMLDSLDWCKLPYGSGDYSHLAESANGVRADSMQVALTDIIENTEHPPSIHELNHLGTLIQSMPKKKRSLLKKEIMGLPGATVTDAINAANRLLLNGLVYDGKSLSDRAVLWKADDPYIRVQFVPDDGNEYLHEEDGVWVNCPAKEGDLKVVAERLGAATYNDLRINGVCSVVEKIEDDMLEPFLSFDDLNNLACAMKDSGVIRELGKYKAVLEYEGCFDLKEAAVLAGKLDDYEFYHGETMVDVGNRYRNDYPTEDDEDDEDELVDLAENLGFEDTNYGIVRKADETKLEQRGQELI